MSTLESRLREWLRHADECDERPAVVRLRRAEMIELLETFGRVSFGEAGDDLAHQIWRLRNGLYLKPWLAYTYMRHQVRMIGP